MIHTPSPLLDNVVVGAFGTPRPAQRSTLRNWQPKDPAQAETVERVDRARQALENHKAATNWDEPVDWSVTTSAPTPFAELSKLDLTSVEPTHPSVVTKKAVLQKPGLKKLNKPRKSTTIVEAPIDLDTPLIDLRQRPNMIVLEGPKLKRIWPQA